MDVYLEIGKRKVFACAVDWPGWCRSAKTEEAALEALAGYADRYREVADEAGVRFPARSDVEVVERLAGDATTDFGAPGAIPELDRITLTAAQGKRLAALVQAVWIGFDRTAKRALARPLRGPPHRLARPRPPVGDRGSRLLISLRARASSDLSNGLLRNLQIREGIATLRSQPFSSAHPDQRWTGSVNSWGFKCSAARYVASSRPPASFW